MNDEPVKRKIRMPPKLERVPKGPGPHSGNCHTKGQKIPRPTKNTDQPPTLPDTSVPEP